MKGKTVVIAGASRGMGADNAARGPAIARQPGLLGIAAFMECPGE
jgi:hypothetical protein